MKRDDQGSEEWDFSASPKHYYVKEKPIYTTQFSDLETMKEKFAKLLLGEDVTGGSKGVSTALALSNAITNLAGIRVANLVLFSSIALPNSFIVLQLKGLTGQCNSSINGLTPPLLFLFPPDLTYCYLICSISVWRTLEIGATCGGWEKEMEERNGVVALSYQPYD